MNPFTDIHDFKNTEEYLNAPIENRLKANEVLLQNLKQTPEFYQLPFDEQKKAEQIVLTDINKVNTDQYVDPSVKARADALVQQATSAIDGKADVNFLDGILEGGRNFLSGKVLAGISDIFVKGDLTESIYGEDTKELEDYRDYVYSITNPEGTTDFKIGKVVGNLLGFGADAASMGALYGSIAAPGLVGKALGQKVLTKALTKAGGKLSYIPKAIVQGTIESTGYVLETGLADLITGKLDEPHEVDDFIKNIPSTAGQGLIYFALGETMGLGLGAAFKNLKKVYSKNGYIPKELQHQLNQPLESVRDAMLDSLKTGTVSTNTISAMKSAGIDEKTILKIKKRAVDANLVKDLKSLEKDPKKLEQVALKVLYGMDTEVQGDVLKIKSFQNEELTKPAFIKSENDLVDFFKEQKVKVLNNSFDTSYKLAGDELGNLEIKVKTFTGKKTSVDPKKFSPAFEITDEVDYKSLEKTARDLIKDENLKVVPIENYFKTTVPVRKDVLYVPKSITSGRQAAKFSEDFFTQLKHLSDGKLDVDTKALKRILKGGSELKYNSEFLRKYTLPDQLRLDPDGSISLKLDPESDWIKFADAEGASAYLHSTMYTPEEVGAILSRKKGIKPKVNSDGSIDLEVGGEVKKYDNLVELFKDPNYRPDLPFEKRDPFLWIKEGETEEKVFAKGTIEDLRKEMKKFEKEPAQIISMETTDVGEIRAKPLETKFTVTLHESGFEREFDTLEQAKKWLSRDHKVYGNIRDDLYEKGWRLTPTKGGYVIQSAGSDPIFVRDLKEARAKAAELENIWKAPDMFSPEEQLSFEKQVESFSKYQNYIEENLNKVFKQKTKYKGFGRSRPARFFDKYFVPIRERLEKTGDKLAINEFDKLSTADKIYKAKYAEFKTMTNSLFHGKGRNFTVTQLRDMGDVLLMEVEPKDWIRAAKENGIELSSQQINVMKTVRDSMDILGKKFGISSKDWVDNYFSRLQKMKEKDFLQLIETNRKGITDSWFKHIRTEDFISTRFENNIEQIFDLYARSGYRELYLGDAVDQVAKLTRAARDPKSSVKIQEEALKLLEDTNEKVIGRVYSSDRMEKIADRILANQAHAKKLLEKAQRENWTNEKLFSKLQTEINKDYGALAADSVTAALMAFKMKVPLRNMNQIFTMLAPTVGYGPVIKAQKFIGDNPEAAARFYKELYDKGIMNPRSTKSFDLGVVYNTIKNWNTVGLTNFKHSDDFTRLVAAKSASDLFRENYVQFVKGEIDMKALEKGMHLDMLHEADRIKFTQLLQEGDVAGAETLFERRIVDLTMFDYSSLAKPEGLNTGIGKAFGQYGTYPMSFIQLMKRGIKADPVGFSSRLLMSSVVLGYFYKDILGMDYMVNKNPLMTGVFLGGPMLTGGITALADAGRMMQDPSLGKIKGVSTGLARIFMPYSGVSMKVMQGISDLTEGDYHAGVVNLLGGNVYEDALIRK